jgi:UDP-glucose 4-epimerase
MKEKILIIGGSGFIGSYVAEEFRKEKKDVAILDKKKPHKTLTDQKYLNIDIKESLKVKKILKNYSSIYYFADIADINESKKKYMETINHNILTLSSILSACVSSKIKKFTYASSLYVYSESGSFYRASKQCAEILVKEFSKIGKFDYKFLRYGSVYGERAQSWNGISKFIEQINKQGKVTYQGSGREIRDYIHVKDAAKLTIKAHNQNINEKSVSIFGDRPLTVDQLFDLIFDIVGKKKKVKYLNKINSDDHYGYTPYRFIPDESIKISSNKYIDLGEGIFRLLKYKHDE